MLPSPPADSSLGAMIGIIVLAVLLVTLLALFLYYRHWQKGKENHHMAVAYTTGRTDSSEYAVPGEIEGEAGGGCLRGWDCLEPSYHQHIRSQ